MSVVLTGIKPTGIPHLGNYFGAIRPALALSRVHETRFFLADIHALNTGLDGVELRRLTLDLAAAWIACGLDPRTSLFYRQSDVPEIAELTALLMPLTPKGLMNRAHAYKARTAENQSRGKDPDDGVNMGLYTYPILMAADILAFDTELVPVGQDQVQHVEMAVDIAQAAGRRWGPGILQEPRALVDGTVAVVPGTDGRKMSKSYGNVLPLFADRAALAKTIKKVPTDSLPLGAPKDPRANVLAAWFRLGATADEADRFEAELRSGALGWGQAKEAVTESFDRLLAPLRETYRQVRTDEQELDRTLREGAGKARDLARGTLQRIKQACFG